MSLFFSAPRAIQTPDGTETAYTGAFKATSTVDTTRFDGLDPLVHEVLIDIAWNSAYYAHGKENAITDAIRTGDTIDVLKNLQKFNRDTLMKTWGGPIRDQWLTDRIRALEAQNEFGRTNAEVSDNFSFVDRELTNALEQPSGGTDATK